MVVVELALTDDIEVGVLGWIVSVELLVFDGVVVTVVVVVVGSVLTVFVVVLVVAAVAVTSLV